MSSFAFYKQADVMDCGPTCLKMILKHHGKIIKSENLISDFDCRNEQSKLLNKKLTLPQTNASIISNENQQNEKEKELVELENTIRQQKSVSQQALFTFNSQLDEWRKKHLLIAPMAGKVTFTSFTEISQQLQANQTVCFINPENTQCYAEVVIPQTNLGKAAIGQKVLLRFAAYPYQEYGSVTARIEFISNVSGEKGYLAKVAIAKNLITTYELCGISFVISNLLVFLTTIIYRTVTL